MLICYQDKNQPDHHNSQIEAKFSVVYIYVDKYQPDHQKQFIEAKFNVVRRFFSQEQKNGN